MVDIETLSTSIDAHVLTIGAVAFTPWGKIEDEFYVRISPKSCEDLNLKKSQDTLEFWKKQSDEAQKEAFDPENRVSLSTALQQFNLFWQKNNGKHFWCQGANFDEPILSSLYEKLNMQKPWKFYNVRCLRTYLSVAGLKLSQVINSTSHNALQDCKDQVDAFRCAFSTFQKLIM